MDDFVQPYWDLNIIDEDELEPEEIDWSLYAEESPSGLMVIDEDKLPPEVRSQLPWNIGMDEEEPKYREEEPDINLIYGFYEESEFY